MNSDLRDWITMELPFPAYVESINKLLATLAFLLNKVCSTK